jgi:hypothetical protein
MKEDFPTQISQILHILPHILLLLLFILGFPHKSRALVYLVGKYLSYIIFGLPCLEKHLNQDDVVGILRDILQTF